MLVHRGDVLGRASCPNYLSQSPLMVLIFIRMRFWFAIHQRKSSSPQLNLRSKNMVCKHSAIEKSRVFNSKWASALRFESRCQFSYVNAAVQGQKTVTPSFSSRQLLHFQSRIEELVYIAILHIWAHWWARTTKQTGCAVQSQKAATAYFSNKQLLPCDYHSIYNTKRWIIIGLTLVHRLRRWTNGKPKLIQRLVSAGYVGDRCPLSSIQRPSGHPRWRPPGLRGLITWPCGISPAPPTKAKGSNCLGSKWAVTAFCLCTTEYPLASLTSPVAPLWY